MNNILFLNTTVEYHEASRCRRTLTVAELMDILECYPGDLPVMFRNDNGYTFGALYENAIISEEEMEEE